jgi:hypothetical protein
VWSGQTAGSECPTSRVFCETWDSTVPIPLEIQPTQIEHRIRSQLPVMLAKQNNPKDEPQSKHPIPAATAQTPTYIQGAPRLASFARRGIPQPHPSRDSGDPNRTPNQTPTPCHAERSRIIQRTNLRSSFTRQRSDVEVLPFQGRAAKRKKREQFHSAEGPCRRPKLAGSWNHHEPRLAVRPPL